MYVCMYIRIYVYMYVFMYVRMYLCMYVCMYACMYLCMCVCMYVFMYVCMYVCMYVYMYVCIMYMYYSVCMYVIMYACMYFFYINSQKPALSFVIVASIASVAPTAECSTLGRKKQRMIYFCWHCVCADLHRTSLVFEINTEARRSGYVMVISKHTSSWNNEGRLIMKHNKACIFQSTKTVLGHLHENEWLKLNAFSL